MIIWKGIGWVIIAIMMSCLLAVEYSVESVFKDESYYQDNGWPKLVGMLVIALTVHALARHRSKLHARHFLDLETGEEVVIERDDSLFFIPLRYWPLIFVAFGIALLFVEVD